ncbi:MAG TPA: T9SS type A sorting domain-containing protein [Saprospiraceae bacterium]|nr:T9SS type A sorting domain-containing protein [Saprospiraceae bacterium]HRK79932.1 T9SS type A sorting domain-containing protein [Saprospiraceae bacterium]
MNTRLIFSALLCNVFLLFGHAQTYLPGQTYYGLNQYIEYRPGTLPIIITAPHGGYLQPSEIPDRNCTDCVTVMDAFTEELSREIADAIAQRMGCRPHLIINRLHRRKLDANRDLAIAANGNPLAETAWFDFHRFIQAAKDSSAVHFGRGLLLDMHGHGHSVQRLELGYLLYGSELRMSDAVLNTTEFINYSSIRGLVQNNLQNQTHAQLLRGASALGTIYENQFFRAVPSLPDPFPLVGQDYFSGGYNTERHGSIEGGPIDAIQIECNFSGVRDTPAHRSAFAQATAEALEQYLQTHYFGASFPDNACSGATSVQETNVAGIRLHPNPATHQIYMQWTGNEPIMAVLYDARGRRFSATISQNAEELKLEVSHLVAGWYVLQIQSGQETAMLRFLKI